ncbi:MAG: UDP-N-acetylenolpyruvoylglucosamine reductase, partial [Lachnospiraceae bacterium]|nr:UDP-N-acetylenolpyruvoylglucosamine reductase [Lachnospiraceae bacterium]
YFAGKLIEEAGLKGFRIGDAGVSEKHAGFVVNYGHASAREIRAVMDHTAEAVYGHSGVMLEPEVRMIGVF